MARSFLERFEESARLHAERVAVSFEDRHISYRELDERANRLARHLIASGVPQDGIVAICGERSPELMIAVLAALKAGAGYLPLDASYPVERLRFMLEDSRAHFLIRGAGIQLDLPASSLPEIELGEHHPVLHDGDATRPDLVVDPHALAYAIYTSGSTGTPKGVAMIRSALDSLIEWQLGDSSANAESATLQFAPLSFDVHFQEMFSTWCSGGRLVLVREELRLEALPLLDLIERERVERLFLPFIALQSLADIAVQSGRAPSSLREVITAGEQLQVTRALVQFFEALPDARLFNHYGPSETHVVTSLLLEGAPSTWPALPSIGHALPHVEWLVLREDGSSATRSEEGELWIGGVALARGYLHRPELTAERFVERDGQRFYRTGDLVQEAPNGEIQFLGRLDGQVKVRGYRIELGEIEVALAAEPSVREAAARVVEFKPGDKRVVGYVVVDPGASITDLRARLASRLPEYMVPSTVLQLDALPRTPSGKVDKRSLPVPSRKRPASAGAFTAPQSELERALAVIWSDVLDLEEVSASDHFFELGGNSLLALRVVARIERDLGHRLPIARFFQYPRLDEQARYLTDPTSFRASARTRSQPVDARAPIAIIGMAGRFPGAPDVDTLWKNLVAGLDSVSFFSPESLGDVPEEERTSPDYVPVRGVLTNVEHFDAGFFGISPSEAAILDPQQRAILELSQHALENAGYAPSTLDETIGVFAGTHNNSYAARLVSRRPDAVARVGSFAAMVLSEKDYVATRVAHKLNLTGPALSIHTACSTSLVALVTAVEQLRAGLCDVALAGGASISVPHASGHVYEEGGMLSKDGHTRTFDASASGTVFSDGAAMIVLKPLARALEDGDTIHAVVRGVGLNNDGAGKASFTAPSVTGQAGAIAMAHRDAGISARELDYVEAHGTATPLGDPIEVEALTEAFRESTAESNFCGLGSIKSNFGHLTAAAGAAGLIKVALALRHETLPPSLHFESPNPKIDFAASPFFVTSQTRAWPRGERPRLAGVSSFGVGGTNAHVVVEEAPLLEESGPSIGPQLFLLSARTPNALERSRAALAEHLEHHPSTRLADAAYTLALGRDARPERVAVVARSHTEAAERLKSASVTPRRSSARPPRVAFSFPGQGAQYVEMGKNLYESEALFRVTVDECAEILRPGLGRDLRELLYPKSDHEAAARVLRETEVTQSALFTIEVALARTLQSWGIEPSFLLGHSVGEFVAACLAGVFDLQAGLHLVRSRGHFMQEMPTGSMLSVRASADTLLGLLPAELDLAAENAEGLSVVAGPTPDIERFAAELEARGLPARLLETSHAFHSRSMDAAVPRFREEVARVQLHAPRLRIVSTATGTWLTDEQARDPDYWASHLRRPVRFSSALATLLETRGEQPDSLVLLEVGPRKTLTTLASQRRSGPTAAPAVAISTLSDRAEGDAEWTNLLEALGRSWTHGVSVDFRSFFRGERRRRIPLPGTSFEPERHWLDLPPTALELSPPAAPVPSPSFASTPSLPLFESIAMATPSISRRQRLVGELKSLFEETSGLDFQAASPSAHFIELGVDSLLVTQLAQRIKKTYRVPVSFRQLMEELPSFDALSEMLDRELPPEAAPTSHAVGIAAPAAPVSSAVAAPGLAVPAAFPAFTAPVALPAFTAAPGAANSLALAQQLIQLQLGQLALFQQQLGLVAGLPSAALPSAVPAAAAAAAPTATAPAAPSVPVTAPHDAATNGAATSNHAASAPAEEDGKRVEYDPKKAFGAIARIYKQSEELTPQQEARLADLVKRYTQKTKSSKAHTQDHRAVHADPRVVTGFKPRIKELVYPIVTSRSEGCRLWDLDGNEYVDALNGFGSNFFGYSAPRIAAALHRQIDAGFEIGPQTTLAGESAKLVCELTGLDRAAFCNTGSEAVMGALRIARTVTGRQLVVAFSGSYHGIFDEVIVRDTKTMRAIPAAPGILPEAVANMLILEYGTEKSLQIIRERADEIAAVLVEPVQSRRPDFRPKEFLQEVRAITRASGSALIFDEVITGFRTHPGGAQHYYGIEADLATYGKIVGGGMPIGVIAGRNPWMDALDGGFWQFGDASIPTAGVTYFAGTFVRHPLAMAAVHMALTIMKEEGAALQERVNDKTTSLATQLNTFFQSVGAPLEIRHFGSLWKTFFTEPQPYGELVFCHLRDRGVHIWDGFPCFLTVAHGDAEVRFIVDAFQSAVREMQAAGFLPGNAPLPAATLDASRPPVPGARLGRDQEGNPAWFVPDPNAQGKYVPLN